MKLFEMESLPLPKDGRQLNPFHHDLDRMGTSINEHFMVMYHPVRADELVIIDLRTGKRGRILSFE